jgi:two-component system, NarL family, nitrate/nitrite response regulator NarL
MVNVVILGTDPMVEAVLGRAGGPLCTTSVRSVAELTGPPPDVIITDLRDVTGAAAVARTVVVTDSCRPIDVRRAMRAGARGYLTRRSVPCILPMAVHTVAAGGFVLSEDAAAAREGTAASMPRLSAREEQTLSYIATGFTHSQIASRLGVRPTTVNTYVERIRTKLGVGNKAQLTLAAVALNDALLVPGLSEPGR